MKILLAVDGSRYTERALAYLAEHDEWLDPRHTYTVFHAVAPVPHPGAAFKDLATVQSLYTEDAEIVLKPVKDFFDKLGVKAAFMHEVGTAGSKIAHMAKTHNFDLLIMGTHGHSALAGLVMGSVTTQVLSQCSTPVLLIR
jgi:nucleotide-binding universal stress UspA family protein